MTRDDIIKMAREAGMPVEWLEEYKPISWGQFEHFAALVAAAEREALVALVYEMDGPDGIVPTDDLVAAIRARSNT